MSTKPLEDYATALETTISTYAATTLSAIQTEAADSLTLSNFATVELGYNNVFNKKRYPVCFVYPAEVRYERSAIGARLATMRLEVWYAVKDALATNLVKKLLRYADAIQTIVFEHNTLGGAVIDAVADDGEFWPGGPDNSGIAAGKVVVSVVGEIR